MTEPPPPGLGALDALAKHLNELACGNSTSVSGQVSGEDGRSASIRNEGEIKGLLINHFKSCGGKFEGFSISCPTSTRFWYDFALERQNGKFLVPVNIKSTTGASADNCGSKEGIFYSLTGRIPDASICRDYDSYFKALQTGIGEALTENERQQKDYYFLVCLKSEKGPPKFFVQTLRSIETLTPNGNNLPFQCAWARNQKRKQQSFKEGVLAVLSAYQASMQLRAEQSTKLNTYLKQLINELNKPT